MTYYSAPIQGFTDYIWRHAHKMFFGGIDMYYSPFIRIENGNIRKKDIKDVCLENNDITSFTPQILACRPIKMTQMVDTLSTLGYSGIDINLGCPFPAIAKKHCGCGMMNEPEQIKEMVAALSQYHDISFSIKMRLGYEDCSEWENIIPLFSDLNLSHITIHPRIGKQQYKGNLDLVSFRAIYDSCKVPLVYNGDITSQDDIVRIQAEFPRLTGIMFGRGLLYDPALVSHRNATASQYKQFHDYLFEAYSNKLDGGDAQLLIKMKTFWEYFLPNADRKARKLIKKSCSLDKYLAATDLIWCSI